MLSSVSSFIVKLDHDYPLIQFLIPYVFILAIGIILIAILTTGRLGIWIRDGLVYLLDKALTGICTVAIIGWSIFTAVFVFPFYCYKNRETLRSIKENKRSQKEKQA